MTRRHKHHQTHPRPPETATAAAAVAGPAPSRWTKLGGAAMAVWYLGGFVLLLLGALVQIGPFAWAAAWQVRHWGSDSVILSFLPGFALLVAPLVLLQLMPRRPDWPFLCGAQDALSPRGGNRVAPPSADRMARVLLGCTRVGLALSLLFPIAGGVGYFMVLGIGSRGAGQPLPELTLAEATGTTLPGFARLVGVVAHPEAGWVHDHTTRQTRYHDVYMALTGPGWQPGDAVMLLEEEHSVVDDDPAPSDIPRAGPIEGSLERGALPGWMVSELRRSGVAVVDDPVVLMRRDLNGVVPGGDMVVAIMALGFGIVFGLVSLVASLGWLYRRRKLLRDAVGST